MEAKYEARKQELLDECTVAPQIFERVMPRLERCILFSAFRDLIIGRFLMASFWSHVAEAVSFLSLYAGFLGSRSVGR